MLEGDKIEMKLDVEKRRLARRQVQQMMIPRYGNKKRLIDIGKISDFCYKQRLADLEAKGD